MFGRGAYLDYEFTNRRVSVLRIFMYVVVDLFFSRFIKFEKKNKTKLSMCNYFKRLKNSMVSLKNKETMAIPLTTIHLGYFHFCIVFIFVFI